MDFPCPLQSEHLKSVSLSRVNTERGIGKLGVFHPVARNFLQTLPWQNGIVGDYFGGDEPDCSRSYLNIKMYQGLCG
jgi:hypothetical protein